MTWIGTVFGGRLEEILFRCLEILRALFEGVFGPAWLLVRQHPLLVYYGIVVVALVLWMWHDWTFTTDSTIDKMIKRAVEGRRASGVSYPDGLVVDGGTRERPESVVIRVPDDMMDWFMTPSAASGPFLWNLEEHLPVVPLFQALYGGDLARPSYWRDLMQKELRYQLWRGSSIDLNKAAEVLYVEVRHAYTMVGLARENPHDRVSHDIRTILGKSHEYGGFWQGEVMVDMGTRSAIRPFPLETLSDEDMRVLLGEKFGTSPLNYLIERLGQQYLRDDAPLEAWHGFHVSVWHEISALRDKMRLSVVSNGGKLPSDSLQHWSHEAYQIIRKALIASIGEAQRQCVPMDGPHSPL